MAITVTSAPIENGLIEDKWGKAKVMGRRVSISGTYDTGGFALSASSFGLRRIHTIICNERGAPATAFPVQFNSATSKVQMFASNGAAPAALAEVANGTNVGSRVFDIIAIGWG